MLSKYVRNVSQLYKHFNFIKRNPNSSVTTMATRTCNKRQLDTNLPELRALLTDDVKWLCNLFISRGYEIRLIGGAVRDMLTHKPPKDIDLSTTAVPDQMIHIFKENEIRYIETGLQHGTLTIHLNNRDYELTTLRIDVETYGRQAKVEFTQDWYLDAERRDLTVNAMSVDMNGMLWDYFNGEVDLQAGKIRFVGDDEKRIREDYLRILRYFRFYGKIAPDIYQHNETTLNTISSLADGLKHIAVERIWVEMHKIIIGNYAPHLLKLMYDKNVAQHIGLPTCTTEHLDEFEKVWSHTLDLNPSPVTLLVTLVSTIKEVELLSLKWKLSNTEKNLAMFIATYRYQSKKTDEPMRFYKDILVTKSTPVNSHIIREHVLELLKYEGNKEFIKELQSWVVPKFPVTGGDLKSKGIRPGKDMGKIINTLKALWVESYYELSKEYLLDKVDELRK